MDLTTVNGCDILMNQPNTAKLSYQLLQSYVPLPQIKNLSICFFVGPNPKEVPEKNPHTDDGGGEEGTCRGTELLPDICPNVKFLTLVIPTKAWKDHKPFSPMPDPNVAKVSPKVSLEIEKLHKLEYFSFEHLEEVEPKRAPLKSKFMQAMKLKPEESICIGVSSTRK